MCPPSPPFCYVLSWGSLDPEFRFGFRVLEARVGMDVASVSRLLGRLYFHVWYLAMGGGMLWGAMAKQVTGRRGTMANGGLA